MTTNNVILHVEDDFNDVELVAMAFGRAKADVRLQVVNDGDQAVDYLSGRGPYADRESYPFPALMLLDLKLPRTSGLEVLGWVRAQGMPALKRLPIIMLTSSNQPYDIDRAYDLGANSYLVKPTDLRVLVELARSISHYWLTLNLKPTPEERSDRLFV